MGYMRHNAIVVTSWDDGKLEKAHKKAKEIFNQVAPITPPVVNGYVSFLIAPDGSKEGWEDSDLGDKCRDEFIDWINNQAYEDGSSLEYIEVQFADEEGQTKIVRYNN